MNPLLLVDYYKTEHHRMLPEGTTMIYSNFTPRKSRIPGIDKVVFFGLQHFCLEYLIKEFDKLFFHKQDIENEVERLGGLQGVDSKTLTIIKLIYKSSVIKEYQKHIPVDTKHIEALWDLGYLPIEIKAVPEGTLVPIGVPCFTIKNTHPDFAWLTNYLETLISTMMWQPITSATIAYEYKKVLSKYALETTGSSEFVQWQGHDFSMRGMSSIESAILSGMGHLTSFTGTDTIPAIYQLEESYGATGLIGASVPATEHSVMCMGTKEAEVDTFKRLLDLYPTGILSVVSDTWNLWEVLTVHLPQIKDQILSRDGKLVIRPDSGDPVDILCGVEYYQNTDGKYYYKRGGQLKEVPEPERKGVIELLWDLFGGKVNEYGYKELDPHIGAIYGDSITLERAAQICERLKAKGFASTNVVLGIGSYTYQYNTRDTFGFAMKATYGEVLNVPTVKVKKAGGEEVEIAFDRSNPKHLDLIKATYSLTGREDLVETREIYKDPITDDGTKRSKKGLLQVFNNYWDTHPAMQKFDGTDELKVNDQCTWEQENGGLLETVFKNGELVRTTTLEEIRERLKV